MTDPDTRNKSQMRSRHITTACDICRIKRCKCDGQMPCSSCRSAGDRCVYRHEDRRRRRPRETSSTNRQTAVQAFHGDAAHALRDGCAQDVPGDVSTDPHGVFTVGSKSDQRGDATSFDVSAGTSSPKRSETMDGSAPCSTASHLAFRPLRSEPLLVTRADSGRGATEPQASAIKRMQGRFRVGTGASRNNIGAVTRVANHPLRPKQVPKLSDNGEHPPGQPQRQLNDSVWQGESQPFPVPGYTRTFGNLPFSSSLAANGYSAPVQAHQMLNFTTPQHLIFPVADNDDSPLGRALADFWQLGRRLIAEGTAASQIADPGLIDVTLFFRDRRPGDSVTTSTWTAEMLRSFRGTFPDNLLLACAVCVTRLMSWYLSPTPENYANIPAMIRPTDLQRLKPHPPWVDLMMFPSFRDALTHQSRDWVEPCMRAQWRLLWPHPTEQALSQPAVGRFLLTPDFAAYIAEFQNWSMGASILETFPEIQSSEINIVPD